MLLNKFQYILIFSLACLFCVKEVAIYKINGSNYSFSIEDLNEDGTENDTDEKNELNDSFIPDAFNHKFLTSLFYCCLHKSYNESHFPSPYSKIQLLPPELA